MAKVYFSISFELTPLVKRSSATELTAITAYDKTFSLNQSLIGLYLFIGSTNCRHVKGNQGTSYYKRRIKIERAIHSVFKTVPFFKRVQCDCDILPSLHRYKTRQ